MGNETNPFVQAGFVDAASRQEAVKYFDRNQLLRALLTPCLQIIVRRSIERRLKQLEKNHGN